MEELRYGFFELVRLLLDGTGDFVTPLIWLAGAKVLPKLDPGPVSADGSGSIIGFKRTAAACN